jgi:hypothetical protein
LEAEEDAPRQQVGGGQEQASGDGWKKQRIGPVWTAPLRGIMPVLGIGMCETIFAVIGEKGKLGPLDSNYILSGPPSPLLQLSIA